MTGLIEKVLTRRYGQPSIDSAHSTQEYKWREGIERQRSLLYKELFWDNQRRQKWGQLEEVYGDALGGTLLGGSLKIALLAGPDMYGLYRIEELNSQPEVVRVANQDSTIRFFMDSVNVWFYGVKDRELVVYDSEEDELSHLGPLDSAIESLLIEWEAAK